MERLVHDKHMISSVIRTHVTLTMDKAQNGSDITALCVGCGMQILDRFLLKVFPDLSWHMACLKCVECQQNLDESQTCFIKDGRTLCKEDYCRLYMVPCASCLETCSRCDYVMRVGGKVYHVRCFRCQRCDRQLLPGDRFTIHNGFLLCMVHQHSHHGLTTPAGHTTQLTNLDRCTNGTETIKTERTARMRTVLSEAQLHVLRSCYSANPRPDALLKEQLVELTGLSARVIRVWFQNKRCKDKKRSVLQRPNRSEHQPQVTLMEETLLEVTPDVLLKPLDLKNHWNLLSDFTLYSESDNHSDQSLEFSTETADNRV